MTQQAQGGTETAPKRRQARGKRRIAELLDAAGLVFAECGYSATTTNAIAARAGVSPGTLYQYFPNKDAIADAVAEQYAAKLRWVVDEVLGAEVAELPLAELLNRVLDPLVEFHVANPACIVLFVGPDSPQRLTDLHLPLHAAMLARVGTLLTALAPQTPPERVQRAAEVAVYVFKGVLPLVLAAPPETRPDYTTELKRTLLAYFSLLVQEN